MGWALSFIGIPAFFFLALQDSFSLFSAGFGRMKRAVPHPAGTSAS
jgi:hypothetical protein